MKKMEIEYNTSRNELVMPEYGRHVQLMIEHAKTLTDLDRRQVFVEKIVDLMYIMNPQSRNVEDYRERLWKHVFRIAGYDLEGITPTHGPIPDPAKDKKKPEQIPYSASEARFRHYGHYVQLLMKKAMELEDGPVKDGMVAAISSYMKLAYRTWNREHFVSDDLIKGDLLALSDGKLSLPDEVAIENLNPNPNHRRNAPQQQQQHRSNQGGKRQGGGQQQRSNKNKNWKRK